VNIEPPKPHPVDLNTPGLSKPYKELRSLINYLTLGLVVISLYIVLQAWILASSHKPLNVTALSIILASLVLIFFCRRYLKQQKRRAVWFYVATFAINIGYTLLTPRGLSSQNLAYLILSVVVSAVILWMIINFIKQGVLK
jgi:hypothetical protein